MPQVVLRNHCVAWSMLIKHPGLHMTSLMCVGQALSDKASGLLEVAQPDCT